MHGYPHFFKKVRNKLGRSDAKSQRAKQRTLSIVDKDGKVIPQDPCKEMMRSEYNAHFTKKNSINNHPDTILLRQQRSRQRAKTAKTQRIIKRKRNVFEGQDQSGVQADQMPDKVQ